MSITTLYAVLTVALAPICYGVIQCRVSDVLLFLCAKKRTAIAGCALGCALANLMSPVGAIDIIFGVLANYAAGWIINKLTGTALSVVIASATIGILIGLELSIFYSLPFIISATTTFLSELICLSVGKVIYASIDKRGKIG